MLRHYFVIFFFCLSILLSRPVYTENQLILAVHPYLSVKEIEKKFSPMVEYLSLKSGKQIIIKVGSSYEEHISFIGKNKVDIAYMGPASYVNMVNEYGEKPILARLEIKGQAFFQGNIIAGKNSNVKTMQDLKGKRIAFGDPGSTMSYIVPHHMLHKAGVFSSQPAKHDFLYSHKNVAIAVLTGDFDAGAVKPAVFKEFEAKGLRTIAMTPEISEHLFVTQSNLSQKEITLLRKTLLDMKNSADGLLALQAIKSSITGLVGASSRDYDNLRTIIKESESLH